MNDSIKKAAKAAARADIIEGGHNNAVMMLTLITKAAKARRDGLTKDEYAETLTPEELQYLGW